jgi:hypothetical protein
MYFFVKQLNGHPAGLASGVLYQLLPYHIFNLFCRGVVPELFAFIWFPLILLFLHKVFTDRKSSSIVFLSFAYAGLIMTHLVSAFMFTFVMIGYALYLSLIEKKKGMLKLLCAIALGLGLSSIYLIPVIFERGFVHIELIKVFDYKDSFLFIKNNLVKREFYPIIHGIVTLEIAFLMFSFFLIKRKLIKANNAFFILLLFISLFLTTPLSQLIWRYVPEFSNLQFPWRWLTFSGLSVSIISGMLISNFKGEVQKSTGIFLLILLVISIFIMFQVSFFKKGEIEQWRTHPGIFSPFEYRPVWLKNPGRVLLPVENVTLIKGEGSVSILEWKSNQRVLSTNSESDVRLKLSTFYYPGWKTKIDNKQSSIMVDGDSGSIIVEVPEGKHKVELIFEDTSERYYAKIISIISLIVVSSLCLYGMFKPADKSLSL